MIKVITVILVLLLQWTIPRNAQEAITAHKALNYQLDAQMAFITVQLKLQKSLTVSHVPQERTVLLMTVSLELVPKDTFALKRHSSQLLAGREHTILILAKVSLLTVYLVQLDRFAMSEELQIMKTSFAQLGTTVKMRNSSLIQSHAQKEPIEMPLEQQTILMTAGAVLRATFAMKDLSSQLHATLATIAQSTQQESMPVQQEHTVQRCLVNQQPVQKATTAQDIDLMIIKNALTAPIVQKVRLDLSTAQLEHLDRATQQILMFLDHATLVVEVNILTLVSMSAVIAILDSCVSRLLLLIDLGTSVKVAILVQKDSTVPEVLTLQLHALLAPKEAKKSLVH